MNALTKHEGATLLPFGDLERMGAAMAKSGLFGMKTADQAIALMLVAQAEGQHPATIAQDYDIIQGRAARKTHSVLARFQAAGGKVDWHALSATKAEATFSHPQGGSLRIDWTIDQARTAGLVGKDNWKHYPRAMLRARCIAEGVRAVYPGAIGGMLVAEEAQDMGTPPRQMGAAVEVPQAPDGLSDAAIKAADGGEQSLKDWWQSITKDERQLLAGRLQELKTMAKEADAGRTVDAVPADEPAEAQS